MSGFRSPEFLVETDWLAQHLDDVVVLDCTTHLIPDPKTTYVVKPGREDFEKGHIPGAQFCDVSRDVSDTSPEAQLHAPDAGGFRRRDAPFRCQQHDAGGDLQHGQSLVGDAGLVAAARVRPRQRRGAERRLAEMDRGRPRRWKPAPARPAPAGDFTVQQVRNLMVGKDTVKAAVGDAGVCTLNALLPAQHAGSGGNSYGRPGHIAGSVNVPAAHLLDPATNTFLPADELRRRLGAVGALDRPVIAYCGGGIAASADALILTMLGHRGRSDIRCIAVGMGKG